MDVLHWVLVLLAWFLGGLIGAGIVAPAFEGFLRRRREKQFLRYARLRFPTATSIEVISVGPTDKQTMENIERRIRDASRNL